MHLINNICVDKYFRDIIQLKHDVKSKCNKPNDLIEIITNSKLENKDLKAQLSRANKELQQSKDSLLEEQKKTHELNRKLYICEANQGVSTTFNISCQFEDVEVSFVLCHGIK